MIEKIETWHKIEEDGSGDYYLVPENLFNLALDEAVWNDPDFEEKFKQCKYIGGFASDILIRGEYK